MKNNLIILFSCLFILTACAFDTLNKGLPRLHGQHVDKAIHYLGLPDSEMNIAGRKIYVWGHQNSGSYVKPVTTPTSSTAWGPSGMYTVRGTSTSYVTESYNYNCTIKMVANKKDIIQSSEYEGNEGGCEHFASGIDQLIKDTEPKISQPAPVAEKKKY